MSFKAVGWAMDQACPTPHAKLILLVLAENANEERGWVAWPTIRRITTVTGLSRSTVQRHTDKLVEADLVDVEFDEMENGKQTSNRYYLRINGNRAPSVLEGCQPDTPTVDNQSDRGVRETPPGYQADLGGVSEGPGGGVRETPTIEPVVKPVVEPDSIKQTSARGNVENSGQYLGQLVEWLDNPIAGEAVAELAGSMPKPEYWARGIFAEYGPHEAMGSRQVRRLAKTPDQWREAVGAAFVRFTGEGKEFSTPLFRAFVERMLVHANTPARGTRPGTEASRVRTRGEPPTSANGGYRAPRGRPAPEDDREMTPEAMQSMNALLAAFPGLRPSDDDPSTEERKSA